MTDSFPARELGRGQSPLAGPNNPGPTLLGLLSLLPPNFRWTFKHFFSYTTSFIPIAASATEQKQIIVDSSSHFIITYAQSTVIDTANTTLLSFVPQLVQFVDSSSQSNVFSNATHAQNVFGDATNPGIFAIPYILVPSATWTTILTNQEATARNVYLAFCGMKSYQGTDVREERYNPYIVK